MAKRVFTLTLGCLHVALLSITPSHFFETNSEYLFGFVLGKNPVGVLFDNTAISIYLFQLTVLKNKEDPMLDSFTDNLRNVSHVRSASALTAVMFSRTHTPKPTP